MAFASRIPAVLAAAVLVLSLAGTAASAQNSTDVEVTPAEKAQFEKRMFGKEPDPKNHTYACFVRKYDAAHLAQHKDQKVTGMKLLFSSYLMEGNTDLERGFSLGVTFRNKRGSYDSGGSCRFMHPEDAKDQTEVRFGCGVECDGGGIDIAMNPDNASVVVRLERVRLWQHSKPLDETNEELVAGKDDGIFRLERAPLEECLSVLTDKEQVAELRKTINANAKASFRK